MKKIICSIVVALVVAGTISSCKKTVKAIFPGAEFDLPDIEIPFQATQPFAAFIPLNQDYDLPSVPPQRINVDSIVRANTGNNFGAGDISSVKLKQMTLTITEGFNADNNFSNFLRAKFSLSSNTNSNKILVASVNFTQADAASNVKVIQTPDSPELRPYLDGTELYYNINAALAKHTTNAMKIRVRARMIMK